METVRVMVVGEDPLARAGLAALLSGAAGLSLAGQASTPPAGTEASDADVLLWDLGPDAAEAWRPGEPAGVPVVLLSDDPQQVLEAIAAGARGALPRDVEPARLAAALRAAALGLVVLDEGLSGAIARRRPRAELAEPLTPRETEVLGLLVEGLSNKLIAARLGISEHTAKFHVNAILGKLGAQSRAEAIVLGARLGLVIL